MKNAQNSKVICVLGMHCSGTSAVARGLLAMDVALGDKLSIEPAFDNLKGFWEDREIVSLNERLLDKLGMNWHSLKLIEPFQWETPEVLSIKLEAIELIRNRFGKYSIWGFKDPRTSRLLPFWKSVFAHIGVKDNYLMVIRNPISVARSLLKRNNIPFEKSHLLWLIHYLFAISEIKDKLFAIVDYDNLLAEPITNFQRIAAKLNIPLNSSINNQLKEYAEDFISQELCHTHFSIEDVNLDLKMPELTKKLYKILYELTHNHSPLSQTDFGNLEILKDNLLNLNPLLIYIDEIESSFRSDLEMLQNALSEGNMYVKKLEAQLQEKNTELIRHKDTINELTTKSEYQEAQLIEKNTELIRHKDTINELTTKSEYQQRYYEQEISRISANTFFLREHVSSLQLRLNSILNSKTWKIGQLYGKYFGVESFWRQSISKLLGKKETINTHNVATQSLTSNESIIISELAAKQKKITPPEHQISEITTESASQQKDKNLPEAVIPEGALKGNLYDVFIFSMIDFDFLYQRPQQLALHFTKKGHRVFYLKITEFLPIDDERFFYVRAITPRLYEVFLQCPKLLDVYGGSIDEAAFSSLYNSLKRLRIYFNMATTLGIVHNPIWTSLALEMKKNHGWTLHYDCLDEWETFKGIGEYLLEQEKVLAQNCDILSVTSKKLLEKWKKTNDNCILVRNACDYEHFSGAKENDIIAEKKKPIIGFFGSIAYWLEVEYISYAASSRRDWNFILLGGIFTDVSSIEKLPNVHLLGNQPYELMRDYLFNFDVCLIPFKKNKITEAVDPVKLYEYFSLGKPVVARDLDEIRFYGDLLYLFDSKEDFLMAIEKALAEDSGELRQKRITVAATNTWNDRIKQIDEAVINKYKKVSIIVVTYNNIDYNKLCLQSILEKTDYPDYEVIVVDNASTDATQDYLLSLEDKRIKIILNQNNEGFARANNIGIKEASGEYLVFLNNDTVVTKGWISKLVNYLDGHPEIGLIGPVTNFCGNEAKIDVTYTTLEEMDKFAYHYTKSNEGIFSDIRMLAFYCVGIRRDTLDKVGLLDENFGIGMFEGDDFSLRIERLGLRIVCAEDIFIHHFGQASFKKLIDNGQYNSLFEANKKYFEQKWGISWQPHTLRKKDFNPSQGRVQEDIKDNSMTLASSNNELLQTKQQWGKEAGSWKVGRGIFWLEHEEVQKRIKHKVSGNYSKNHIQYLISYMTEQGYKLPVERCLTLGCGVGQLERELAHHNFTLHHDAYDVSDKALEEAIIAASKEKLNHIHYEVRNINEIMLPADNYDVIFGFGSVHHFLKLEHIFNEVNKSLKKNGIFFLSEYIGPSFFQWSERQLEVINCLLKILPKRFKADVSNPSVYKEFYLRPTINEVRSVDPSEACRSEEIVPLLNKYFDVVEIKETGGAILHSLLTNIAGNFKTDSEIDMKLLNAIFSIEDVLMAEGDIISDFAVIIAKKKN